MHIMVSFMAQNCAIKFLEEKYLIIQKSVATPTLCFEGINVVLQFLVMFIIKNNCFSAFLQLFAKLFGIATFSQHKNYGLRQSLIKKFQHVLTKQQYYCVKTVILPSTIMAGLGFRLLLQKQWFGYNFPRHCTFRLEDV